MLVQRVFSVLRYSLSSRVAFGDSGGVLSVFLFVFLRLCIVSLSKKIYKDMRIFLLEIEKNYKKPRFLRHLFIYKSL